MKKILFIAYYYPPIKSGGSQRPINFIKYLKRNKYDVTLLTSSYKKSYFSEEIIRIFDISFNKDRRGFRFFIWLFMRFITEFLIKIGFYHSIYSWWRNNAIRKSKKIIEKVKPDLIIVTYPPVETLEIGLFISKKYNIPLISDFRDGLLFEPIEKTRIYKYKIIKEKYSDIEKEIVHNSISIISVSDPVSDYFINKYGKKESYTIYTGFDPEDNLKVKFNDGFFDINKFNILFTGRFSLADKNNRVQYFFDAIRGVVKEDKKKADKIVIHLIGEFNKDDITPLTDLIEKGLIVNWGYMKRDRVLELQKQADLLLIITLPDRVSSVSTKIFEYLMSGTPILALTHETILEKIVVDTRTGWVVHPQKVDLIESLLKKIIGNKIFYNSINREKKLIDFYSSDEQVKKLVTIIKKKII